jgi:hypothetical protein
VAGAPLDLADEARVKTTFDPVTMSAVTLDDQRPRLAGGGTADAAVPNTLGGLPVTLDCGGRVTSLNGVTFSYDFLNRVTGAQSTSGGNTVIETYGYDAFLRRVQRAHTETSPPSTTSEFYVFDGADLVATVDDTAQLKDAYLFAGVDHPLRLSRGGSSYFYELDLAGNVRRLRDASGADLGGGTGTPRLARRSRPMPRRRRPALTSPCGGRVGGSRRRSRAGSTRCGRGGGARRWGRS